MKVTLAEFDVHRFNSSHFRRNMKIKTKSYIGHYVTMHAAIKIITKWLCLLHLEVCTTVVSLLGYYVRCVFY
jgi:hypothetical protein